MTDSDPMIRHVSDTAIWAANYRAEETVRPDALFRDPWASRLASDRGARIDAQLPGQARQAWAWVTRTYLFDAFITERIAAGIDTVVNLAAGLDARPYRMALPATLRWIEVDLPDLLAYKAKILEGEQPRCIVERIALDLASVDTRRTELARRLAPSRRTLVLSEGLLIYFTETQVASLALDLAAIPSVSHWVIDIVSPGLMQMMTRQMGAMLDAAGSPFRFGPKEGPGFFVPHGWRPLEVKGLLKTAGRLRRLSPMMRLLSLFPESTGRQGSRPWSAVCLLGKT